MASKGIYMFAAHGDLVPGLLRLETMYSLLYLPDEIRDTAEIPAFRSCRELPSLGQASSDSWIAADRFRVVLSPDDFEIRPIPQEGGGVRYGLGWRTIKRSVILRPGGVLAADTVVIQGEISTISEALDIIQFYRSFAKESTRGFVGQGLYRLGPTAIGLCLNEGYSLKDFASAPTGVVLTDRTLDKYYRMQKRIGGETGTERDPG